jgi:hypothetical protein
MKKYHTIDKYIIGIILLFILMELIINTQITVQCIGIVLMGCYLLFIMSHIGLCWPIIFVLIFITEEIDLDSIPSKIIQYIIRIILISIAFTIMYFVIPIIITSLVRYNFDMIDNYNMYVKILKSK